MCCFVQKKRAIGWKIFFSVLSCAYTFDEKLKRPRCVVCVCVSLSLSSLSFHLLSVYLPIRNATQCVSRWPRSHTVFPKGAGGVCVIKCPEESCEKQKLQTHRSCRWPCELAFFFLHTREAQLLSWRELGWEGCAVGPKLFFLSTGSRGSYSSASCERSFVNRSFNSSVWVVGSSFEIDSFSTALEDFFPLEICDRQKIMRPGVPNPWWAPEGWCWVTPLNWS